MKQLTNLKFMAIALFIALFSMSFAACSDDDDDDYGNELVGTWYSDNHYYGGTSTFKFMSDGTYRWTYSGSATWFDDDEGRYYYEKESGILTIVNKKGTTWLYVITAITDSYFTFIDENGDVYTYDKRN